MNLKFHDQVTFSSGVLPYCAFLAISPVDLEGFVFLNVPVY